MNLKKVAVLFLARTSLGRLVGFIPFVRPIYKAFILSRRNYGALFYGIYSTYEEALYDIPKSRLQGWNHQEAASIWLHKIDPVRPSTYPVFFWLLRLFQTGSKLIDFGGSIGLTFYGYRQRAVLPENSSWIVVELPELVAKGRLIALEQAADNLYFETELSAIPESDIFLAAGAFQFMRDSVSELLAKFSVMPRHIILNKLPLTDGAGYWTLHNFGPAIAPDRVFNRTEFMNDLLNAGYTVCDEWINNDMSCDIPFHPNRLVSEFTGLYLTLTFDGTLPAS